MGEWILEYKSDVLMLHVSGESLCDMIDGAYERLEHAKRVIDEEYGFYNGDRND